jgi:hypothetical protein
LLWNCIVDPRFRFNPEFRFGFPYRMIIHPTASGGAGLWESFYPNLAPRLGVAWHPGGKSGWVFRAGTGLFYDRYPLGFLNDGIQKDGVQGFEQYLLGAQAAQAFALYQGGTFAQPFPGVAPSIYRFAPGFLSTYSRKLTAGVELKLAAPVTPTLLRLTYTLNYIAWIQKSFGTMGFLLILTHTW